MLLDVKNLSVEITKNHMTRRVIDGISFSVDQGEMFGLVGESGSGKSLTALTVAGLLPEGIHPCGGKVLFEGADLLTLPEKSLRALQGSRFSMIFQEPMTSLNPLMKAGRQVEENLILHTSLSPSDRKAAVLELFKMTGLPNPQRVYDAYPHELSGGMRQRVMIALAVILKPSLIIADEPTTALDVTVQAKILRLLKEINEESGAAVLLISHDLSVIRSVCSRVAVMYAGKIVETGPTEEVFLHPAHEYTKALIAAIPTREKKGSSLGVIGDNPQNGNPGGPSCPFAPRCARAQQACRQADPKWLEISPGHKSACIFALEGSDPS